MIEISEFEKWLEEISDYNYYTKEFENLTNKELVRYHIFTETNKYSIVVRNRNISDCSSSSYLGCMASRRKPRAGETWVRGNDLPDGPLNRETWDKIKDAILRYELVKIETTSNISEISVPESPKLGED